MTTEMPAADVKSSNRKIWRYLLFLAAAGILAIGGLAWYASTDAFQLMVRTRLVNELERVTGGRVEVGSAHTVPFRFRVEVRDITIHGRERASDLPFVHIDRLIAQLKITSVLSFGLTFRSVAFERPTIHLISYADGTTNQPLPAAPRRPGNNAVENLFALSIDLLEVRSGELFWNDQRIPLDFMVNDVFSDMSYFLLRNRYEGSLLLGKAMVRYKDFRPVAWTGAIYFRLRQSGVEVRSLELSSGETHIRAQGILNNFAHPSFSGTYDANIDIGELNTIARMSDVRSGTIEVSGKGAWTAEDFSSVGKIEGRNLSWRNASLNILGSSFDAGFSLDPERISLPDITARLLAGTVAGSAEIVGWQSSQMAPARLKSKKRPEQESALHLRFRNLSAAEIASSLSTARRPFGKMNIAGDLNGGVDARWRGSLNNLVADVAMDIAEPATVKPGQLPVKGHAQVTYRRALDELEVAELTASTKATQVRASGILSNSASVKLSVSTSNLGEWQPILIASGYDQPVPVKLLGPASFNGTATGRLSSITFTGKLQSGNFDFIIPATSRTAAEDVHWDSFITDFRISPAGLALRNSILRRNITVIAFDINLGLQDRHFSSSSPFTARVNMQHGNLAELRTIFGYDYPVTGTLDLSVQLSGTRNDPEGSGQLRLRDAMVYSQPIQQLSTGIDLNNGELAFHNIEISQSLARVSGSANYTPASHAFKLDISGTHFDLERIASFQSSRVAIQGQLDFVTHASGTLENPDINAQIHLRNLTLDQELAGDFAINAISQGNQLHVTGTSQFKGDATLSLEGTIRAAGDWPATVDLKFAKLDADSILRSYLHGHVTGHSAVAGGLRVEGPLRHPSELNLTGNLSDTFLDIESVKLHNSGPVRFTLSNHVLKIEQMHLLGDNTDLSGNGSIDLATERLDFTAQGRLNLQLMQSYYPDITSTGAVNLDVVVKGTPSDPLAQGRMQIANASIAYAESPSALSGLNGSFTFNQGRFEIENLTGHVGGGEVSFTGHASIHNRHLTFDLGLHGKDVRLRYPTGVSSTANLDLQFVGDSSASNITGDITVTKLAITPGFDFGAYLQRTAQSAAISQTNAVLNRIRLDVHIVTLPELQVQTAVIRLSGDADLHLRGTAAKSVLLGRADVLEGQAYLNGTRFRLERGDVTFTNPVSTVPVVDLQASTQVRDYDIALNLNGPADKLNLTYRSEPPLPTMDIIALLAFGQTTQQSTQLQQNGASSFNQDASNAILAAALNATVSNRAQRLFGVSRIKIDPQGLNTETSPTQSGPAITIEQQVASNVTVSYSTNVSQTSQQVIQAEYNVTRDISVLAIRDQNGVVSFDVRIRQRKK
jgi:translocation and assembly module TamB